MQNKVKIIKDLLDFAFQKGIEEEGIKTSGT